MADADGNRYGPYDIEVAGSEAEPFTEEAWFDLFDHLTGVKSGGALTFTGLTATLAPLDMRVHGSYLIREDPWSDASSPTSTSAPRRDMLVARRQRTSGEGEDAVPGKTFLLLLQGTPAATPADPTFDPDDDEPLWSWQVPGGGGTVVSNVRDLRRWVTPDDPGAWTPYSTAWSTTGTIQPAVGNGSLVSVSRRLPGRVCEVDIYLSVGSTTNLGNGDFRFTLPVPAAVGREHMMLAKAYLAGPLWVLTGNALVVSTGGSTLIPYLPTSPTDGNQKPARNQASGGSAAGTSFPAVPAAYAFIPGSNLVISGRYETAS